MNELFQCTVCFDNYDDTIKVPRLLPCQHTFCSDCLPNLVDKTFNYRLRNNYNVLIQCPICRIEHYTKLNDVPKSRIILNLLEIAKDNQIRFKELLSIKQVPNESKPIIKISNHVKEEKRQISIGILLSNKDNWNLDSYIKELFEQIDKNKDNLIEFNDLQEALNKGQLNNKFNYKTVKLLFDKYDIKRKGELTFDEFNDLYNYLNNEYITFIELDLDSNGYLDSNELSEALYKRGSYRFSKDFYSFIENTMKENNREGITFDNYCRLIARFDYLCTLYSQNPKYQSLFTLENYLRKTFFYNFW